MTRAYAAQSDQIPNDLALLDLTPLLEKLNRDHPQLVWAPRIKFGGLLDVPDQEGETLSQSMVAGIAADLLDPASPEKELLNLEAAIVRGRLPERSGEIIISDDLAHKLEIALGQTATLIGSTMYGSLSTYNFIVVGTIRFGIVAMDRGTMIADIRDIQAAMDMQDGAGELLGFMERFEYDDSEALAICASFNQKQMHNEDEFAPVMMALTEQNGLAELLDMYDAYSFIFVAVFVFVMFIVLWNAGLMGSLRRYGEIGVRLAIGENKKHVYGSMLVESLIIAIIGSVIGTGVGLSVASYLQHHGIDISSSLKNSSMLISNVLRARITPISYIIGFFPGIVATLLGSAISGFGIYKRQTSQLFKELEV
jgi:putative ABC transport system permease protein